jgi:hypothetical protein
VNNILILVSDKHHPFRHCLYLSLGINICTKEFSIDDTVVMYGWQLSYDEHVFVRCDRLTAYLMLVSCFAYTSTLKMEAIYSSETSVGFQCPTSCYIPEDRILQHLFRKLAVTANFYLYDEWHTIF